MGSRNDQPARLSARTWTLARWQWDAIARTQLLELGWHPQAIQHRLGTGRLFPTSWRGVYAVGRRELAQLGRWSGAVLACRGRAVLSHRSAAALWGLLPDRSDAVVELSVRSGVRHRLPGLRIHRRSALAKHELGRFMRLPVTRPATTLIDLATVLKPNKLEGAVNEADKLDLIDPEELRTELDHLATRPGLARLRKTLDRRTFTLTDTQLERRFLPIAHRAGLPLPETQQYVNGFRVDFYWPTLRLVVETDGLRYHRTPAQQARDRLRDQQHAAAGLTPLRFTRAQVRFEPEHVESTLATVARRLAGAS